MFLSAFCSILYFGTLTLGQYDDNVGPCQQPRPTQPVVNCPNPEIQNFYYFDSEHLECLAFSMQLCPGQLAPNGNLYQSWSSCSEDCKLMDGPACAAGRDPYKDPVSGQYTICQQNGLQVADCPSGWMCRMGAFHGMCCHQQTEEKYERNYKPHCAHSHDGKPVGFVSGGIPLYLLGRSCQDKFCPLDSECVQLDAFAHCCKRDATTSLCPNGELPEEGGNHINHCSSGGNSCNNANYHCQTIGPGGARGCCMTQQNVMLDAMNPNNNLWRQDGQQHVQRTERHNDASPILTSLFTMSLSLLATKLLV